jgi:hypothetical protein
MALELQTDNCKAAMRSDTQAGLAADLALLRQCWRAGVMSWPRR